MNQICWEYCQEHSVQLLSSGLAALMDSDYIKPGAVTEKGAGVYLMSLNGEPVYIGEAKDLRARLRQQFKPKTSTFYKNYIQAQGGGPAGLISAFDLKVLQTHVGRKELEEFGIVNLPAPLNRFHRDKRERVDTSRATASDWGAVQHASVGILDNGDATMHEQPAVLWPDSNPAAKPGLYLVYDPDNTLIYIGESSDVKERHMAHSGRTYFSALRRNIGRDIFGFQYVPGKKKQFYPEQDVEVSAFLNSCKTSYLSVEFGRLELEEHLIRRLQPILNRKSR